MRHRGHPVRRIAIIAAMIAVTGIAIGAVAAVGWVVAVANSAPNLDQLKPDDPHPLSEIFAADGTLLGYVHSDTVFTAVPASRIPLTLKQATVAIEDRRFWQHGALDYQGILRAGIKDVFSGGDSLQGASTLTMQLVDNMYMPRKYATHHDLKYKIVQAKLAEQLESKHSKAWILDTYLNDVPYGTVNGATAQGVAAAAQMFFNKPVWKLSLAQQALLAGLPQSPTDYNPFFAAPLALSRRNDVLQAMVTSHYITPSQAATAEREPLGVRRNRVYSRRSQQYVFDYAFSQLVQHYGLKAVETGGLKAYTTIQPQMQYDARAAILAHQPGGPVLDDQPAAALAAVDPSNGHILALGSSATYAQTNFDYAVQAHRQPGSAFKVFALMTLIHDYHGDPDQTYYVSKFLPTGWLPQDPTWSVHTAEETYQGTINVTKATVVSDNTVFAQLAADEGWAKLDATARAMGVTTRLDANPAEVIGGLRLGVTPLEMADAYATIANGGYHIAPTIVDHVVFPDGTVDTGIGKPAKTQVFSYGETYAAIQVLKGVITDGTGTAAGFGCPAAGKTGTAEGMDNAWFVGFTPKISTAVWVGLPQGNIPMANGFGGALAAPIWHDFMQQASNGFCSDWSYPNVPFAGTAYFGDRAVTGNPGVGLDNSGLGGSSQTTTATTATTPTATSPSATTQPQSQTATGTTGGATTGTGHRATGTGTVHGRSHGATTQRTSGAGASGLATKQPKSR